MFPLRNINSEVIFQMSLGSLEGCISQTNSLLWSDDDDSLSEDCRYSINYFKIIMYSFMLLLLKKKYFGTQIINLWK